MLGRGGLLALTIGLIFLSACEKSTKLNTGDPKSVLQGYIQKSFDVKKESDRDELLKLLSGPARVRLENWSDDQFREAFIDSKRKFLKLTFRDVKKVSEQEVNITYDLLYSEKNSKSQSESIITNKKLCFLVLENGQWTIQNVKTLKELIEYQNEMSLP